MDKPIIFYDGNCGLCHSMVKFVLNQDKQGIFNFSPRQGQTVKTILNAREVSQLPDSVYLIDTDGKIYLKAFAVSRILKRLGGIWAAAGILYSLLPWRLNNFLYDCVAKTRYKFFSGKTELCPLIPEVLKARFLT